MYVLRRMEYLEIEAPKKKIAQGVEDVQGWLVGAPAGSAPVSVEVWAANTKRRHRHEY
jgi:hypothetical protein